MISPQPVKNLGSAAGVLLTALRYVRRMSHVSFFSKTTFCPHLLSSIRRRILFLLGQRCPVVRAVSLESHCVSAHRTPYLTASRRLLDLGNDKWRRLLKFNRIEIEARRTVRCSSGRSTSAGNLELVIST